MELTILMLDKSGVITRKFLDELSLVKKPGRSIYTCFDETHHPTLQALLIDETKQTATLEIEQRTYYLWSPPSNPFLCISDQNLAVEIRTVLEKSMTAFNRSKPAETPAYRESEYYNEIQKLNNQLINKTREVEKLNRELNRANKILTNRLVKDPLTNLTSRYQYQDEIERALKKYPDRYAVFCFIDLDDFKTINDTYGHDVGDRYLKVFADRLKNIIFRHSIKMRIAGDEFGIFIYNLNSIDAAFLQRLWQRFKETVVKPIDLEGISHKLELSMGIARYPVDSTNLNQLIDFADFAMYMAKRSGKNTMMLFDESRYKTQKYPTRT